MKDLIKRLFDARARAWEEAKALLDAVEADGRDGFSAEEQEKWDRLNADMDASASRATELIELDERNRAADAQREEFVRIVQPENDNGPERELEERVRAFLRGEVRTLEFRLTDNDKRAAHARQVVTEYRDLSKLSQGAGLATVPESFVGRLYEHLVEESAVRRTGASIITTASGEDLLIPKTTTHPAAALVAEAAALAESDPVFAQVTLKAFKYGVIVQVSSELIADSGVNILEYLARQCGLALGRASGVHNVTGSGSGQPEGVATNVTTGKTGATGQTTSVIIEDLVDLFHSVVSGYRGRGAWLMLDASLAKVRKIKDSDGQFIWQPGLQAGQPDQLLGRPVVTDPNVAAMAANAKSILFGDFSSYYTIRDVASLRFERSDDFAFANDLVSFRALIRTDGQTIDNAAVKAYVNSAT